MECLSLLTLERAPMVFCKEAPFCKDKEAPFCKEEDDVLVVFWKDEDDVLVVFCKDEDVVFEAAFLDLGFNCHVSLLNFNFVKYVCPSLERST